MDRTRLEKIFNEHGFHDFKWIRASEIETAQWVRMKCAYGCDSYGRKAKCPPYVPTLEECRRFFSEYEHVAIFHFHVSLKDPDLRKPYTRKVNSDLLQVERSVFLMDYHKAFLFFMDECRLCDECPGTPESCVNPTMARPSPESFCVDVFATVRKFGFPIRVLENHEREMNRYAFLMVE
jgi:predicted metal-binding protein